MTFGWRGQILRVNLTHGTFDSVPLSREETKTLIGARGLAAHLYAQHEAAAKKNESQDNALIFATAPLTGTLFSNSGRFSVVTRPAPNANLSCAALGGAWGPELKYAGFDAIVIEGKSSKPVYLWISNGEIELRDAGSVWGKNVRECSERLRSACHRSARVCCIGPAGENGLSVAAVVSDMHIASCARGVATTFGEKNLKAIVVRGTTGIRVAHPTEFMEKVQKLRRTSSSLHLRCMGSKLQGPVLQINSALEDDEALLDDGVRPTGCFGCMSVFTSFTNTRTDETLSCLRAETSAQNAQLQEQREFVDLGLDYVLTKALLSSGKFGGARNDDATMAGRLAHGEFGAAASEEMQPEEVSHSGCTVGGYVMVPGALTSGRESDLEKRLMLAAAELVGSCAFAASRLSAEQIASLLRLATGVDYSPEDVLRAGEKIAEMTCQKESLSDANNCH